jgi:hypothetical protein
MLMEGRVGAINASVGTKNPLRTDTYGSLAVFQGAGKYAEAAIAGRLFHVANQAVVACTAGLATTWTGLGIANPSASGKLLVLHQFTYALNVVGPAAAAIGLMETTNSGFAAAIAARPVRPGMGTSVALVTLGPNVYEIDGSIVVPPGYGICTYAGAALTAALMFSFTWEEVSA